MIFDLQGPHCFLEPGLLHEDRHVAGRLFEGEQLTEDECDSLLHVSLEHA